jgi:hypothetical protein
MLHPKNQKIKLKSSQFKTVKNPFKRIIKAAIKATEEKKVISKKTLKLKKRRGLKKLMRL